MKLAPVLRGIDEQERLTPKIIHTGQHYDTGMSDVFFQELGIPQPDVHLGVGSGTHGAQTAKILERYESHLIETSPSAAVVFGDVNSTVACALAAVKLGIPIIHVEAGLRSFDRTMPEEINRLLTDAVAELLLVSEPSGLANLKAEGVAEEKTRLIGNVMIDTLIRELAEAEALQTHTAMGMVKGSYGLVTMHRPSNTDDPVVLKELLTCLARLSEELPLVFPVHPRTRQRAEEAGLSGLLGETEQLKCIDPISYRENLCLMAESRLVITDSGGMQEETTHLKVPCLTMRENTERPITVERGTSRLVGNDPRRIEDAFGDIMNGQWPAGEDIPLWDGRAGSRVASEIADFLLN